MPFSIRRSLLVTAVALSVAAAVAVAGPPWLGIEYPANPHDASTRGAFLVVVNSVCGCAARNLRPAVAAALIVLGADGSPARVTVPTRRDGQFSIPRAVTAAEVAAALGDAGEQRGGSH